MERKFGEALREAREGSKKSMGDVARELGFSVPYISDIERDRRNPPAEDVIRRIAAFLGVDADALVVLAAQTKKRLELEMRSPTPGQRILATALTRRWAGVTPEQAEQVRKVLEGGAADGGETGHDRGNPS